MGEGGGQWIMSFLLAVAALKKTGLERCEVADLGWMVVLWEFEQMQIKLGAWHCVGG